jgi:hypothetical protein
MGHVGAYDLGAGGTVPRGLWVHGACCSATFEDINVEMSNISGTTPCVFGNFNTPPPYDANAGIHVSKLSCVHPGSGQNAIVILQNTNSVGQSIGNSFRDIFMEQSYNGSQDNTTPWVAVRQVGALPYPAADLLEGFRTGIDTPNSTRCVLDIGTGSRVNVSNLGLSNNSRCAIYDNTGASGVWTLGAKNSVIANYNMTPLFPGAKTVGSLPAANENIGAIFRVTDSTPITTEGQTCAGGGSNTALAFSNGTVWKCF